MPRKSFMQGCPLVALKQIGRLRASGLKAADAVLGVLGEAGPCVKETWNK